MSTKTYQAKLHRWQSQPPIKASYGGNKGNPLITITKLPLFNLVIQPVDQLYGTLI